MNLFPKKLCLVVAGVALVLAGCTKRPTRPDPNQTVLGPSQGGPNIFNPSSVPVDVGSTSLQPRDEGFDPLTGINRTALEAQTVYFDFDRSEIKPSEREKLRAAKAYLDQNPAYRLILEGHADWRGTAEYNLGLGDRRANSVKRYLQSLGVAPERLETISKGSLEAVKNGDDAAMAKDRRVNLLVANPTPAGTF